ncbi:hypothetical protein GBAR_LOCUS27969 [Geodia barretti]|uniref:Uncharacterized protein n=1 Tax=Geodia barretti TaxID=519541 RepID=A0AA35XGV2_GEOBA|nr:hypothetical protein GBAR_LOCUS27969 [Geodia barretti]
MWHYLWPHIIYHSTFYLLKRIKLLVYDYYVMYCPLPIYKLMVCSILLSLLSLAFSIYFLSKDHLSQSGRNVFHLFGLLDLVFETVFIYYTKRASVCVTTAAEMYIICYILSVCAVITTGQWKIEETCYILHDAFLTSKCKHVHIIISTIELLCVIQVQ